jgi:hypothetical protein
MDGVETSLQRELLGKIGSSGSGDAGADDNEPSELIIDSLRRSGDRYGSWQ